MLVFSTALSIPKSFNLPAGLWATHPTYLHTSAYFPLGSTCCLFMENRAMAMITLNSNGGILLWLYFFFFLPNIFYTPSWSLVSTLSLSASLSSLWSECSMEVWSGDKGRSSQLNQRRLAIVNHLGPMTGSGLREHNNKTEEMNSAHNDHDWTRLIRLICDQLFN